MHNNNSGFLWKENRTGESRGTLTIIFHFHYLKGRNLEANNIKHYFCIVRTSVFYIAFSLFFTIFSLFTTF
jgi:hypothetical protein